MSPQVSNDIIKSLAPTISCAVRANQHQKTIYFKLLETRLNQFVHDFIKKFWAYFAQDFDKYGPNSHIPLTEAVQFLTESCRRIEKALVGQKLLKEKFLFILKTHILSEKPYYLNDFFEATYLRAFRTFMNLKVNKEEQKMDCDDDDENDYYDDYNDYDEYAKCDDQRVKGNFCSGCSLPRDHCDCKSVYEKCCQMNNNLRDLGLMDVLAKETIMMVSKTFIERRVAAKCKSNYSYSYLDDLSTWVAGTVLSCTISQIYGEEVDSECVSSIHAKLVEFLHDAYAEVRVTHMFEIIVEYPSSEAAIQDLKSCLEQSTSTNFRLNLIDNVKQSLVESLLHPGVNTYDILTAYISAIKALRALDPSGLILQLVTEPVRRYLKSRSDTVRCIVTALTDEDNNSELNREMIRTGTQTNENGVEGKSGTIEMNLPTEGERCTANNFEKWKPDPIKLSSTDDVMKTTRFSDIVSILVNIYETKDLFVEEYQKLLSQRLLNKYDECNLDIELRNLELLTLRFNDCELHRCEVMLKDVQTSKRVNKRILSGDIRDHKLTGFKNLDVLIVSSPFWPEKFSPIATLNDEPPKISFPPKIQAAIDTYTKAFEAIQASRTLHWRHHLGSVDLDVTINGKVQNFTVSPLHAALLCMFETKKTWKLHEILQETSLSAATVRSRLALWQRNGLIRDCGEDKFELITE